MKTTTETAGTRLVLMYHNVTRPGDTFGRIGDSVTRYFVTAQQFAQHAEHLSTASSKLFDGVEHFRVVPNGRPLPVVTPRRRKGEADTGPLLFEITFDDGWLGSFEAALPTLEKHNLTATVFVTTGLIGQRHFADAGVIREAVAAGRFRIGAHGITHRLLETLSPAEIEHEMRASKETLEQILDAEVDAFALPGGSRSTIVRQTAKRLGYRELHTSVPSTCPLLRTDPIFEVPRFAVQRDCTSQTLQRWIDEPVGLRANMKHATLELAKTILGRNRYASVRRRLLGSTSDFDMTDLTGASTLVDPSAPN